MGNISDKLQIIISHIGSQDLSNGQVAKIDSQKEYNLLGQYLNGSYTINNYAKDELSKKEIKSLNKILKSMKKQWGESSNTEIKTKEEIITKDNVKQYLDKYLELESLQANGMIDNEPLDRLDMMFFNFLKDLEYPGTEGDITTCNIRLDWTTEHCVLPILDNLLEGKKIKEVIKQDSNEAMLQKVVEDYKAQNETSFSNPENVDIGDGDFDEIITQKSDVCPFLAGINALTKSEGKVLLENNRYRDAETGIYAIHLQEAEDCGLPSNGVYVITPQEIIDAKDSIAEGEGDSVAYLLAIDKYFKELHKEKPELADEFDNNKLYTGDIKEGNYNTRFYNIITGLKTTELRYTDYNNSVPLGINLTRCVEYSNLAKIVEEDRGAAVLSIVNKDGGHAISVVGVSEEGLLIQESNNNSELFLTNYGRNNKGDMMFTQTEALNGKPTYILTPESYYKMVHSTCLMRWQ